MSFTLFWKAYIAYCGLSSMNKSLASCAGVVASPGQDLWRFCWGFDLISPILKSCKEKGSLLHICAGSVFCFCQAEHFFPPQKRFTAIIGQRVLFSFSRYVEPSCFCGFCCSRTSVNEAVIRLWKCGSCTYSVKLTIWQMQSLSYTVKIFS